MTTKITFSAHTLEKLHKELTKIGTTENTVTETLKNPDEILYDIQTKRYIAISLKSKIAAIYEKLNDQTPNSNNNIQYKTGKHHQEKKEVRKMDLIIRYDPEVDILVIKIREGEIADEELLDNDILIGYDQQKRIISIEIWEATKKAY